ncbi:hypothetical protein AB4059_12320 [Lysobacter sp. 2RAF19]
MQDDLPSEEYLPPRPWPWPIRVLAGLFVAFVALCCLVVSSIPLYLDPQPDGAGLGRFGGTVLALVSLWVLSLALRLIFNRPDHGGLLPPWFFRLFAVYLVAFPIFIVLTGRDAGWSIGQYVQAGCAVFTGVGYWGLAAWRKASQIRA